MFVLVVGSGRVGSSVATKALRAGHTVSVLDEDPLSHERLDVELSQSWGEAGGGVTVGAGRARRALRAGDTVSVLDEDPLSHERLDVELSQSWEEAGGRFTIGTALE